MAHNHGKAHAQAVIYTAGFTLATNRIAHKMDTTRTSRLVTRCNFSCNSRAHNVKLNSATQCANIHSILLRNKPGNAVIIMESRHYISHQLFRKFRHTCSLYLSISEALNSPTKHIITIRLAHNNKSDPQYFKPTRIYQLIYSIFMNRQQATASTVRSRNLTT